MGKGMGAVDKNMRKELSLEIDGHACPDQYVNVGIGVEIKFRAPHAIDAIPYPNSRVDSYTGRQQKRQRKLRRAVHQGRRSAVRVDARRRRPGL